MVKPRQHQERDGFKFWGAKEQSVNIDQHYKQCVTALQHISQLADTGSRPHKEEFATYYANYDKPSGWRIVETDPRYMECPPDCDCERCEERNVVSQFGKEQS